MPTVKQQPRDADRLSAYSDAVFAVIVTIMVLQLSAPHSPHLSALIKLWQPAVSYLVSYVFIAIIWINHHYLSRLTRATTLPIIWINFVHLFFVSLLPFTTAWIAQTRLAAIPVVMYAALFVCADGTYNVFERRVLRESDEVTDQQRRMARYRSLVAFALFTSAAVLAGFVPWAGFGLICLALVLHLKPDIGVRRRRRYYRERCCQGSCAARARQSRPADRADGPAMRLSRRIDPAHLTVQGVLNSYTCCRSPSRSGMTGRNSARSPGSGGKEDDAAVGPGGLRERDPPAAAPRHGARCRNFGLRGDPAGRQRGERRGQADRGRARRRRERRAMGRRRLHAGVRGADLVGRGAGGPVRSQAPADGRFRRVHPGLGGLRPGPRHRRAGRGPRGAGRRRGGARGFLAVADQPHLPGRGRPGPCGQRVDGGRRGDPGCWAADRRAADRRSRVAVDLLYQPAAGRPRVVAHPPVRDHHPG